MLSSFRLVAKEACGRGVIGLSCEVHTSSVRQSARTHRAIRHLRRSFCSKSDDTSQVEEGFPEMYPGENSEAARAEQVTVTSFRDDTKFDGGLDPTVDYSKHVFFEEPLWPGGPGEVPDKEYVPKVPALANKELPEWILAYNDSEELQEIIEAKKKKGEISLPMERFKKIDEYGRAYGTGRRKAAVARVWITPREGVQITEPSEIILAPQYQQNILMGMGMYNSGVDLQGKVASPLQASDSSALSLGDVLQALQAYERAERANAFNKPELTPEEEEKEAEQQLRNVGVPDPKIFDKIDFVCNNRQVKPYFMGRGSTLMDMAAPFIVTNTLGQFDVWCTAKGGGYTGQVVRSGAIRLGIARALQNYNPNFRPLLKANGLLTRDARVVERKKPGQKKARKKFQWVKR